MRTTKAPGVALAMVVLAVSSLPAPVAAQDLDDIIAYVVLNSTPAASFAPAVTRTMLADPRGGPEFIFRYGHGDFGVAETNNLGLTLMNGSPRGSFGITAGYWNPDCDDCDGHFIAGLGGDIHLLGNPIGAPPAEMLLTIALSGEFGFGNPEGATMWSAVLGAPVTLVAGSARTGTRVAPFLIPAIGWGRVSDDGESESGTRPMLGGGLAIQGREIGATFGFQKVFIEDGETTFGINVSIRM